MSLVQRVGGWVLCGLLIAQPSLAQERAPLNAGPAPVKHLLLAAYRSALNHDPVYLGALQEEAAARELIVQAEAARRPEVALSASVGANRLNQSVGAFSRSSDYLGNGVAVQLRQPLINKDLDSRQRQAYLRVDQASALVAVRHLDVARRVVDAFLQLVLSDATLFHAMDEVRRQSELVQTAERALASGEGTVTEVLEASSRHQLLKAQVIAAQNARDNAREALEAITGESVGWQMQAPMSAVRLPAVRDAVGESPSARHPELWFRRLAFELAQEDIKLARAPYEPRLEWVASVSRSDSDTVTSINQVNTVVSAGLQFNMPLYSGGRQDSVTRQAFARLEKVQTEVDEATIKLRQEERQARRGADTAAERLTALQSALSSTEQLIAATQRSMRGGVRSRLDLLVAERQLAQVRREQRQALVEYLGAWWRLTAAQGTVSDEDLIQLDQALF